MTKEALTETYDLAIWSWESLEQGSHPNLDLVSKSEVTAITATVDSL